MNWEPVTLRPGYTSWQAQSGDRSYLIQKKDGPSPYRMFFKDHDNNPNRTILVGLTLKECTDYAEVFDARVQA